MLKTLLNNSTFLIFFFAPCALLTAPVAYSEDLTSKYIIQLGLTTNSDDTYNIKITSATTTSNTSRLCYGGCYLHVWDDNIGLIAKRKVTTSWAGMIYASDLVKNIDGWTFNNIDYKGASQYSLHFDLLSDYDTDTLKRATGPLPVLTARCQFDKASYPLSHGNLQSGSVNGNVSSVNINISCNRPSTIKATALSSQNNSSDISLGEGIISSLKIDGVEGKTGVIRNNQKNITLNLSSNLNVQGAINAGEYQGSGILKIDFQ